MQFVFSAIIHAIVGTDFGVWIGLHDMANEGNFVWIDGMNVTSENNEWLENQPDNYENGEDCAHINLPSIFPGVIGTNDAPCHVNLRSLCEKRISIN